MAVRSGEAVWEGTLREGGGSVKVGRGLLEAPFSWDSRFEQGAGTNPEELIAAAHAGCYSMSVSSRLGQARYVAKRIHTVARVTIEMVEGHHAITGVALEMEAEVPGISETAFASIAEAARTGCPVSRALAAVAITLKARLLA